MKIWIVGNGTVGFELRAWKRTLPRFDLIEADRPEGFPSIKKAMAWKKGWWSKVAKHLRKRGHTLVICPASIATEWGLLLPPREIVFDMAIIVTDDQDSRLIAARHAGILKTVKAKRAVETARALVSFLREIL